MSVLYCDKTGLDHKILLLESMKISPHKKYFAIRYLGMGEWEVWRRRGSKDQCEYYTYYASNREKASGRAAIIDDLLLPYNIAFSMTLAPGSRWRKGHCVMK